MPFTILVDDAAKRPTRDFKLDEIDRRLGPRGFSDESLKAVHGS